jgi:TPR repeat protein
MMRIMTRAQKISIGVALAAVVASVAGSGVLNPEIRRALGLPQQLEDPADRRAQASATAPASSETRATTVDTEKAEADARPDERTTFSAASASALIRRDIEACKRKEADGCRRACEAQQAFAELGFFYERGGSSVVRDAVQAVALYREAAIWVTHLAATI